ncbi:MAG TPA: 5'/3'-nucleotidase SurE [Polyangiaceae bacterium]|nr:5'/3'-nucleotidase SurE [Polyangiaceae bacterium]
MDLRQVARAPARPLILLANDDGYQAKGIRTLAVVLRQFADVIICAPETEQSTTSHSLSLTRPLRLRSVTEGVFAVDGTPADCVYVALNGGTKVLSRTPDAVVSGMNHGLNLGADVFYSGTVAAAREGALRGIPAMAVSADAAADSVLAATICASLVRAMLDAVPVSPAEGGEDKPPFRRLALAPLLNVNVPAQPTSEVVATRLGLRLYEDIVEFRTDPRGREYLWIGGGGVHHGALSGSDTEAHDRGAVSVTPLLLDLTSGEGSVLAERLVGAARP